MWFYLQENAELFRADTTSQSWKDYVNYIDSMVLDEFDQFIRKSLSYLMDNMVADVSNRCETYVYAFTYTCIISQIIFHYSLLQDIEYSSLCLENPVDGGAWWAAVHGVAKSRT